MLDKIDSMVSFDVAEAPKEDVITSRCAKTGMASSFTSSGIT